MISISQPLCTYAYPQSPKDGAPALGWKKQFQRTPQPSNAIVMVAGVVHAFVQSLVQRSAEPEETEAAQYAPFYYAWLAIG